MQTFLSYLLGLLDILGAARQNETFFSQGLGRPMHEVEAAVERWRNPKPTTLNTLELVVIEVKEPDLGAVRVVVEFKSPVAELFSLTKLNEQQRCGGEIVVPEQWATDVKSSDDPRTLLSQLAKRRPFVFHCPMTGDVGLGNRRRSYALPLAARGIGSVILYAPGYGRRRPAEWGGKSAMPSVYDMIVQSCGIVSEVRAVASALRDSGASSVCYAGVSFGGVMATLATMLDVAPVANVSTAGCHAPFPAFEQGIMKRGVDQERYDHQCRTALRKLDSGNLPEDPPGSTPLRIFHHCRAMHDRYLPSWSSTKLYDDAIARNGVVCCSNEVLPGGHGWVILMRSKLHVDLIEKSLKDLHEAISKQASQELL